MTIIIEHPEFGRVEGVKFVNQMGIYGHWRKNGAIYASSDGWREVKPVEDVMEQVRKLDRVNGSSTKFKGIEVGGECLHLPRGYHFEEFNAVALPEHWWKWADDVLYAYCKRNVQAVLLIKKEGGG